MDIGTKIGVFASGALLVLGCSVYVAWQAVHREQAELQLKLNAAEQQVHEATARQENRDTELNKTLAQLAAQKKTVQTPQQVLDALPSVLPLPEPLSDDDVGPTCVSPKNAKVRQPNSTAADEVADQPNAPEPKITLPANDLKPLYDFAVSCKACQTELATTQADLKDERVKSATLSRERDNALQAARGGTVLKRVIRAAKWFALGAAAGAVAAKLAR